MGLSFFFFFLFSLFFNPWLELKRLRAALSDSTPNILNRLLGMGVRITLLSLHPVPWWGLFFFFSFLSTEVKYLLSGASSLPASLPSSFCPYYPTRTRCCYLLRLLPRARREALKCLGHICFIHVHLPPPYISAQVPFTKVALIPLHPDPVRVTE